MTDKRSFVKENLDWLNDYELDDVHQQIVIKKFKEKFGVHLTAEFGKLVNKDINFKVDSSVSYDILVCQFQQFLEDNDVDYQHINESQRFSWLQHLFIVDDRKRKFWLGFGCFVNNLVDLLLYIKNGEIPEDLKPANDIQEKYGMNFFASDSFEAEIQELDGIIIKKFKNGRYQLKNVDDEVWESVKNIKNRVYEAKRWS